MKLYEINQAIADVIETGYSIDEDTGEVLFDEADLNALNMAFNDKLEACALYTKGLEAEAEAIKAEEKRLAERRRRLERRSERMRGYILRHLAEVPDRKLSTARCELRTRKSQRVEVVNEEQLPIDFLNEKLVRTPNKAAIKKAIKLGETVPGAALVEVENLQLS